MRMNNQIQRIANTGRRAIRRLSDKFSKTGITPPKPTLENIKKRIQRYNSSIPVPHIENAFEKLARQGKPLLVANVLLEITDHMPHDELKQYFTHSTDAKTENELRHSVIAKIEEDGNNEIETMIKNREAARNAIDNAMFVMHLTESIKEAREREDLDDPWEYLE